MSIYLDFNGMLAIASLVAGVILLLERYVLRPQRISQGIPADYESKLIEYVRAFFPVFLLVLGLRVIIAEPFRIPSGSMKPTLLEGEFIIANKFLYGIRLPVTGTKIIKISEPKRGDIVVFRSPQNPQEMNLIKRIVAVAGDIVSYKDKVLYVNGQAQEQVVLNKDFDVEPNGYVWKVSKIDETLDGLHHEIFLRPGMGFDMQEMTIPDGHYFAMGDNRDNSEDSRSWGVLSDEYLIGKATYIWMSWDGPNHSIRWDRLGKRISLSKG
ncbi:MAG: signal peptidase I [Legionellales bacterium]|nr:signal peptidase I [Legionellales bacterium]|tara:strand:- start:1291 stop:2094 length:804 start_codon:yes stop_codon:yes gene_type:complete